MNKLSQICDFTQLFTNNTPLIDTRAPLEFEHGAFPNTQNLPLINNQQRQQIGICYKNKGQQQALDLGHKLVHGAAKQARVSVWLEFIKNNPNGALYCFRGGLRSQITQQWIFEASGINYPLIKGGYKALRRFLIDEIQRIISLSSPLVLGGPTGSGKTLLLNKINHQIDLESLANHRGSAFGNTTTGQPTQINFENALAIALIKKQNNPHLLIEDEGANIGTVHIPKCVQSKTAKADLILLKTPLAQRIKINIDAYVINMYADFKAQDYKNGFDNFANYWLKSLDKIQKRLGLESYKSLHKLLVYALAQYQNKGEVYGFYPLISSLLLDYYDPMYAYQIKNKSTRIVFQGNATQVLEYLAQRQKQRGREAEDRKQRGREQKTENRIEQNQERRH